MIANQGFEVAFHGEYREIVPNERIVSTETFEGAPDAGYSLTTVGFAERDERTTLTILTDYPTREIRDLVISTGMEGGLQESLDHLEAVAISLS
jgi:uncharacterized protein YndB with AHSA1/START domain